MRNINNQILSIQIKRNKSKRRTPHEIKFAKVRNYTHLSKVKIKLYSLQ
jgi:hypothetical protein